MLTKCICTNCAGHLEFEEENAGEKIDCPHCGFQTTLFLPGAEPADPEMTALLRRLTTRRWLLRIGAGILVCAALVFVLRKWCLPFIIDLLPATAGTLVPWLVLICACIAVPLLLFWLVFPILLCLQLRTLTRIISQLAQNTKPEPELVAPEPQPEPDESSDQTETVSTEEADRML